MNNKSTMIPFLLAALSGALMAIQGTFNSTLGKIIGFIESTFVVHLSGTVLAGLLVLFVGHGHFQKAGQVPWFAWLGGIVGVGIVLGVIAGMSKLGAGLATTAIVAAQLLTAYLIDQFGLFGMQHSPFTMTKIVGIALIVAGTKFLCK